MKNKKLYDYLISIKSFLKNGFMDDNVSFLGMSKLEKNQGQNDGEFCVLAYDLPLGLKKENYSLIKRKEEK